MHRIAVVGGGISGLCHAWYIKKTLPDSEVTIFEGGKWGGNIATEVHEGCTLEPGPDSYLDRNGVFNSLAAELGIADKLLFEQKRSAKRFILKEGYLVPAPKSPLGLITTSLLFFPEKIRIFLAMGKKFSLWPTITLFDFARNVLGFSAAEYMASPFARGVYGSEAEDLEFSSMFPQLYEKISKAPKLKVAMKEYARERREFWQQELGDIKFERGIYSMQGGLITLVNALQQNLEIAGVKFVPDKIARIQKGSSGKPVLSSKAKSYDTFDRVVFTGNTGDLAYIFREHDKELSRRLGELKYSPINVVYSCWNKKEFSSSGYGFLVPRKERAPILGSIFASNVFPGRAPEDRFLTKTMVSGDSELFKDEELASLAQESLGRILKSRATPLWSKVYRHRPGIPRYAPGYGEWKREVLGLAAQHEGVHFAGWAFAGIGLADQVESAYMYARALK
ncbi:MAG TPA: protoporphyrinogen oxidase [Turneriella sp.]|nr:protoporphyrinogen oxidase [Turneriella sp.]